MIVNSSLASHRRCNILNAITADPPLIWAP